MHARLFCATTIGIDAHLVQVEVDVALGLVNFFIVGLPDAAIKESSKRIQTALTNSGIRLPARRITVNLAPAHLKKVGTQFDLPIACAILTAIGLIELKHDFINETLFLGELSLNGAIQPVRGILAIAADAKKLGKKRLIVAVNNAAEASAITDLEVIGVDHITQLVAYLRKELIIYPYNNKIAPVDDDFDSLDYGQVKGQMVAKRALQIAVAGRHNILFIGPPGAGKTMLAKRLPTIMPSLSFQEQVETSKLYSITGKLQDKPLIHSRPFRNPHHTISQAGLIGGGSFPQPGELSLAHNGVLFLDEFTEFKRDVIESLREPLESKQVHIARAQHAITYPARCMVILAMNPCPCGYFGDKKKECICSKLQINKYLRKLSGPLLDRIDLQVPVESVSYDTLKDPSMVIDSKAMQNAIAKAYDIQSLRNKAQKSYNSVIPPELLPTLCILSDQAETLVKKIFDRLSLSMRGYHKLLKVARTIADLECSEIIESYHIQEAITYRSLDQYLEQQRI